MKLWVDDMQPAPEEYMHCISVESAKCVIQWNEVMLKIANENDDKQMAQVYTTELIDIGLNVANNVIQCFDYTKLLNWLEETGRSYPIRIHGLNPVGVKKMREIIKRNGWVEIR